LDQFDETLRAKANAISSGTELHGKHISVEISEDSMREYDEKCSGGILSALARRRLHRPQIKITGRWRPAASRRDSQAPEILESGPPFKFSRPRHRLYIFTALRREGEGATIEPVEMSIVLASDRRELDETLAVLAVVLLGCGALLLVATGLIVPRVLGRGLAPLNQVAEQTTHIDADSLSTRFSIDSLRAN